MAVIHNESITVNELNLVKAAKKSIWLHQFTTCICQTSAIPNFHCYSVIDVLYLEELLEPNLPSSINRMFHAYSKLIVLDNMSQYLSIS